MGIFDGIMGGQSGLTHTTTTTNTTNPTNPAQQMAGAGAWAVLTSNNPQALLNSTIANNPQTWNQAAYTPFDVMQKEIDELRYILQRTVENYDELLEQHKALRDITEAERNAR
jgi:hypothetical protein